MTETLQISSPSKLALIQTLVPYLGQERHEGLLFYPLEPQATQQGPRNWVKSTHRGSGAVILNVIFTEATREFLWATAKSQQHREAERGARRRETCSTFFFFPSDDSFHLYSEYSSSLPPLGHKRRLLTSSGQSHALLRKCSLGNMLHHVVGSDWCRKTIKNMLRFCGSVRGRCSSKVTLFLPVI